MIEISGIKFKTKKSLMTYSRNLIKNNLGKTFSKTDEEFHFLKELLKRHPERKVENLEVIQCIENFGGHPAIYIRESNKDLESISWNKCVSGLVSTDKAKLRSAMRSAIVGQILDYKSSQKKSVCSICGCKTNPNYQHVDHLKFFEEIATDFENTYKKKYRLVNKKDHMGYQFENEQDKNLWEDFHRDKAILRITCSSCNLKRKPI